MKILEFLKNESSEYNGGFMSLTFEQLQKLKGGKVVEVTADKQHYNTQCGRNCGCSNFINK